MPGMISKLLREQIRLIKPILTNTGIAEARRLQDALGELEARVVAGRVHFREFDLGGISGAWAIPYDLRRKDRRVALYLHGGGYVAGSIKYAQGFAGVLAAGARIQVMCVAYRLAPEHPYPAALEDALTAYAHLLEIGYRSQDISVIGESAGGGLVFALCLALKAQETPLPARMVALSPWTDLSMSGDSYGNNAHVDVSLTAEEIQSFAEAYAPSDPKDPLASPLFGDLQGLPPARIYVGGDEILLDDSRAMAEALEQAGTACKLTVAEGMWHAYVLYGVPEATQALREIKVFFEESGDE